MKIRLLNCNGYHGMDNVPFPVEVEGEQNGYGAWVVTSDEMARIGCDMALFYGDLWCFSPKSVEAAE